MLFARCLRGVWDAEEIGPPRARRQFLFSSSAMGLPPMGHRVHHRLASAVVCGLLSVLVLQCVIVSRAKATCGDWLAHPGGGQMKVGEASVLHGRPMDQGTNKQHSHSARLPLSKPCNGPYCRSAPFQPIPTAPVSLSLPTDRIALFVQSEVRLTPRSGFEPSGEPDVRAMRGFPSRIDHPPRA
jgi:hypothetical protein